MAQSRAQIAFASVAVAALTLVGAGVAYGHGAAEDKDYESKVTAIEPAGLPVEARVTGGDDELRIENKGDKTLIVYGYSADKDTYLKLEPDGVYVNHNSGAYYLNQGRYGGTVPEGTGEGKPDFQLERRAPSFFSFHDHRIHWMSKAPPKFIDEESDKRQKVYDWEIPFRYGDTEGVVKGRLDYVKAQKPFPTEQVITGAAVLAMLIVFGFDYLRRRKLAAARDDEQPAPPANDG